jgi:hypothetical protein
MPEFGTTHKPDAVRMGRWPLLAHSTRFGPGARLAANPAITTAEVADRAARTGGDFAAVAARLGVPVAAVRQAVDYESSWPGPGA